MKKTLNMHLPFLTSWVLTPLYLETWTTWCVYWKDSICPGQKQDEWLGEKIGKSTSWANPLGPSTHRKEESKRKTEKGRFSESARIVAQRLLFLWFTFGLLKTGNGCTSSQVEGSGPLSVAACVPNDQETSQNRSVSHKEAEEANKCQLKENCWTSPSRNYICKRVNNDPDSKYGKGLSSPLI